MSVSESFEVELPLDEIELEVEDSVPDNEQHEDHERPPEHEVPDGDEVSIGFDVAPVDQDVATAGQLQILRNVEVRPSAASVSVVCEPTVASQGDNVLFTANWFAALSSNGGQTFRYINPYRVFNPPPRFCCDQVVTYVPQINMFIWSMQSTGFALHRLLYAHPEDAVAGRWKRLTITPALLRVEGADLDYPDLASGSNMLYWSTNVFRHANVHAAAIRIPLAGLTSGNPRARVYRSGFSSLRFARNCDTTGHFAAHFNKSTLRVFSWNEGLSDPTWKNVAVPTWNSEFGNSPWLRGSSSRVMGGARLGDELWFAWNVGPRRGRPQPFSQIVRIDRRSWERVGSADLWGERSATGFASLATNSLTNEVGASFAIGTNAASHAIALLTGQPASAVTIVGERDTATRWGDYLGIREHYSSDQPPRATHAFVASGFALDAQARARPHAIWFQRG
jgi:hypothetical protein